jgi:tRNA (guanine-N7-)-methyltransferase
VIEQGKPIYDKIKGQWGKEYFKNDFPITLEVACGRGEYTVGLASRFKEQNFIGIDVKGDRIWKGSTLAIQHDLKNVAFLRANALTLENFFEPCEVSELWIIHPDPRPRKRDIKRRLTSERFLNLYKRLVQEGGWIRLKTDNLPYFEFTLEELSRRDDIRALKYTKDLYNSELLSDHYGIKTRYEQKFGALGHKINYLKFKFKHVSDCF